MSFISVLGYGSKLVEYRKGFDAKIYTANSPMGFIVSAVNGQRFYTDFKWENPIVLKMKGVKEKGLRKSAERQKKKTTLEGAK